MALLEYQDNKRKEHPIGCISNQYRFIVLLIPKNASSTIRLELGKEDFGCVERRAFDWKDPIYHSYRHIAFLREPIDRFLSGYAEVYERYNKILMYNLTRDQKLMNPYNFLSTSDSISSIYEFLEHVRARFFFDNHIKKQISFLEGYEIDSYFSVEDIHIGMQYIRTLCALPLLRFNLPNYRQRRHRESRKKFVYFKEELPRTLLKNIAEVYHEDIDLYKSKILDQVF